MLTNASFSPRFSLPIADGITYTFGIFVVELMDYFGEGRSYVSLIPSILVGVTLGSGPIASVLVNRYGCRRVTIVGSLIAASGLMISAAATSITMLYLTIGIMTGVGFGLAFLPAIVSVSMYLSLIHISEPTRQEAISYAVFCLKKKI